MSARLFTDSDIQQTYFERQLELIPLIPVRKSRILEGIPTKQVIGTQTYRGRRVWMGGSGLPRYPNPLLLFSSASEANVPQHLWDAVFSRLEIPQTTRQFFHLHVSRYLRSIQAYDDSEPKTSSTHMIQSLPVIQNAELDSNTKNDRLLGAIRSAPYTVSRAMTEP